MKLKHKSNPLPVVADSLDADVTLLNNVCTAVGAEVIGKHFQLDALKLALLTGANLLLQGPHGVAKTMLARAVFERITGATLYDMQFTRDITTDQVYGAMDSAAYKEHAIYRYNVKGMLPDVDFAILDEIYRASPMLLPAMMQILNERKFNQGTKEGPKVLNCPLSTAVGTCNFTLDDEKLAAFHDRWLIRLQDGPLSEASLRRLMLATVYRPIEAELPDATISMAALRRLKAGVRRVEVSPEIIKDYEATITASRKNEYVSDRRYVQGLRLAQANAVLAHPDDLRVNPTDLLVCGYATTETESAYFAVAGAFNDRIVATAKELKEDGFLAVLEKYSEHLRGQWTAGMSPGRTKALRTKATLMNHMLGEIPPDDIPTTASNCNRLAAVKQQVSDLMASVV